MLNYRRRIEWAILVSVVLHVMVLSALALCPQKKYTIGLTGGNPLIVRLQPPPPPPAPPKRLVETPFETEAPPDAATDLISDKSTRAQDMVEGGDDASGPAADITDAFPQPAVVEKVPETPPAPEPEALPEPEPDIERIPEPKPSVPQPEPEDVPAEPVTVAKATSPRPERRAPSEPAPQQPAAPEPSYAQPSQSDSVGNAVQSGFLSFEALEHEFGPYMLNVRKRVERRWRALLGVRYMGNTTTSATIDCAIAKDGTVKSVKIVNPGDNTIFATLCKQAIEQAGPFGPFPFEVPAIYKDEDLRIRWTFSFR